MSWIESSTENRVRILRLNRGVTNPLNGAVVQELALHLQEIRADREITALVITSANEKFFSMGFDIPELFQKASHEFGMFF